MALFVPRKVRDLYDSGGLVATQRAGVDLLAAKGFKVRGVNFAPNPAETGPGGNKGHWFLWMGTQFSSSFIDQQIAWANQVGANTVTVYLDYYEMMTGAITQAAYTANLVTTLDKIRKAGLYCQVTLVGWGSGSPSGVWAPITGLTGPGSAQDLLPYAKAFAELVDTYPNVLSLDIATETNMAWIQTLLGAGVTQRDFLATLLPTIRGATTKPISASFQLTAAPTSAIASDLNLQWIRDNLDFLNFHPYYGNNQGPSTGPDPSAADFRLINTYYPGKLILLGECGSSKTSANLATNMGQDREIMELPFVIGGFVWSLNAFQSATAPSYMFSSAGVEQTAVTQAFRTWPRRNVYQSLPLPLGGAGQSLAGSLTDVTQATAKFGTTWMDSGQNRDPQYRLKVVCGAGLISGDHLQVVLADLADVALQTVDVFAPGSSNPTIDDSGPNAMTGNITGTVTSVTGPTGFSNGIQMAADSYVDFGSRTFSAGVRWTYEMKVKRSRTAVTEKFFVWGGAVNSFPHIEMAFNSANNVTAVGGKSGSGIWSITSSNTITDTNWHDIAVDWDGASKVRLYVDGTMVGSTTQAANPPSVVGNSHISWSDITTTNDFVGSLDELRASNLARYGADGGYTPATTPFSSDANTVLLIHADTINAGTPTSEAVVARGSWTYVTQSDITVKLKAANLSGARGKIISSELEVRYA